MIRPTTRLGLAMTLAVGALAACGGDDDTSAPAETAAEPTASDVSTASEESTASAEPSGESSGDNAQIDGRSVEELYEAAKAEGEIVLYASTPVPVLEALQARWEATYPDVKLSFVRADQGELRNRFQTESQGGRASADVISADNVSSITLGDAGLLTKYEPQSADAFSPAARAAFDDGYGVPWRGVGIGFAVNTELMPTPPTSWAELPDAGTLVWPDPRVGGGAYALYLQLQNAFGDDYMTAMGAAPVELRSAVIAAHESLAAGEFPILLNAYHYVVAGLKDGGAPVEFVVPEDGLVAFWSEEAIAANATHPNAARLYINFILSDDVQTYLANEAQFIPAIDGIESTSEAVQAVTGDDVTVLDDVPIAEYGDTEKWVAEMNAAFSL